jgi:hypothetical protein
VVTGLGFALMEDNSLVDGKIAVGNLGEFKYRTRRMCKLTTMLLESATGPAPFQGKAIAEIPCPDGGGRGNAIEDAVGGGLDLLLTAEKIYAALENVEIARVCESCSCSRRRNSVTY